MSTPWRHHHLIRPFRPFMEVEGTLLEQRRAWEHNRQHRYLLSRGAAVWILAAMACIKLGGFFEASGLLAVAVPLFLMVAFLLPGALIQVVAYFFLGKKFEEA